jgi:hypothetical protein
MAEKSLELFLDQNITNLKRRRLKQLMGKKLGKKIIAIITYTILASSKNLTKIFKKSKIE